jgi:hypothetical protein
VRAAADAQGTGGGGGGWGTVLPGCVGLLMRSGGFYISFGCQAISELSNLGMPARARPSCARLSVWLPWQVLDFKESRLAKYAGSAAPLCRERVLIRADVIADKWEDQLLKQGGGRRGDGGRAC